MKDCGWVNPVSHFQQEHRDGKKFQVNLKLYKKVTKTWCLYKFVLSWERVNSIRFGCTPMDSDLTQSGIKSPLCLPTKLSLGEC